MRLKREGKLQSMFGRVRRLPEINAYENYKRNHAIKQGCNFLVQSAAASICKRAMIELHKQGFDIRNQIHDAIYAQVRRSKAEEMLPKLKGIMENVITLDVPLTTDAKILETFLEK